MTANAEIGAVLEALKTEGYAVLRGHIETLRIEPILDLVRVWSERTEGSVTKDLPEMSGDPVVWNLQNKDARFLSLVLDLPVVEAVLKSCLNDDWYRRLPSDAPNYILRAYVARCGTGALPLHIDSFIPYVGGPPISMQCAVVLEEMSAERGATLFVPGSHRSGAYAPGSGDEAAIAIDASPGDVLLWDSRIWHGAKPNQTPLSRWMLIATFTRWWIKQAFDVTGALPPEIYRELTDRHRAILGFCSVPHHDETEGIVTQKGYEVLANSRPGGPPESRPGSKPESEPGDVKK